MSASTGFDDAADNVLYDVTSGRVGDMPIGFRGIPVTFIVHTEKQSDNHLVAKVNGRTTRPVLVLIQKEAYVAVTFIPTECSPHNIYLYYNDTLVQGCPFRCYISEPPIFAVHCQAPHLLQVSTLTAFQVKMPNIGNCADLLDVKVTDMYHGIVERTIHLEKHRLLIEFMPMHEGDYIVEIRLAGNHINDSPMECIAVSTNYMQNIYTRESTDAVTQTESDGKIHTRESTDAVTQTDSDGKMHTRESTDALTQTESDDINPFVPIDHTKCKQSRRLGQGSFGDVYLGYDMEHDRDLAIKHVTIDPTNSKITQVIQREVQLLSKLRHQRIVAYYGTHEANHTLSIYMEYLHGGSVADQVKLCGRLGEKLASKYTWQVLEGLEYLHSKNIIHRDIKGANILRDSCGNVKIADFGCSKQLDLFYQVGQRNTASVGTFYWMSPEVLTGSKYDCKADIWSLGCTVVEMITCSPPWHHLKAVGPIVNHIANCDHPIYQLPESASHQLRDFLNLCFKKATDLRPTATILLKHAFCRPTHRPTHLKEI